jgi:hypothetical protein
MKSRAKDHALATLVFLGLALVSVGISGGPVYGKNGAVTTTGTYAGVMFATSHVPLCINNSTNPPTPVPCTGQPTGLNQIGLFSLPIPKTGLGSGTAVLFNKGQIYTGTIQATGDPKGGKVTGIFSATFPYIISVPSGTDSMGHPTFTTQTVSAQASGNLHARVKSVSTAPGTTSIRLKGAADVQFELTVNNPFDEIIFSVLGFKQAEL